MVEDVLNEMKRTIAAHLPEELRKQEGHSGDGLPCDDIPETNIILGDQIPPNYGLPAMIIRPESMEGKLWATGKKDVNYKISVAVCVTDTDPEKSQKKLWRTLRAVENAFEINLPGKISIIDYKTEGIDYHASLFDIAEPKSVEKGGIISAMVIERLDAYISTQV